VPSKIVAYSCIMRCLCYNYWRNSWEKIY